MLAYSTHASAPAHQPRPAPSVGGCDRTLSGWHVSPTNGVALDVLDAPCTCGRWPTPQEAELLAAQRQHLREQEARDRAVAGLAAIQERSEAFYGKMPDRCPPRLTAAERARKRLAREADAEGERRYRRCVALRIFGEYDAAELRRLLADAGRLMLRSELREWRRRIGMLDAKRIDAGRFDDLAEIAIAARSEVDAEAAG